MFINTPSLLAMSFTLFLCFVSINTINVLDCNWIYLIFDLFPMCSMFPCFNVYKHYFCFELQLHDHIFISSLICCQRQQIKDDRQYFMKELIECKYLLTWVQLVHLCIRCIDSSCCIKCNCCI